jgi:hypothetical protein
MEVLMQRAPSLFNLDATFMWILGFPVAAPKAIVHKLDAPRNVGYLWQTGARASRDNIQRPQLFNLESPR